MRDYIAAVACFTAACMILLLLHVWYIWLQPCHCAYSVMTKIFWLLFKNLHIYLIHHPLPLMQLPYCTSCNLLCITVWNLRRHRLPLVKCITFKTLVYSWYYCMRDIFGFYHAFVVRLWLNFACCYLKIFTHANYTIQCLSASTLHIQLKYKNLTALVYNWSAQVYSRLIIIALFHPPISHCQLQNFIELYTVMQYAFRKVCNTQFLSNNPCSSYHSLRLLC